MRGKDQQQLYVFSYISPEQRVPQDHPLRSQRLRNEAQVHRDTQALASMIGDKFVDTEWDGEVSDRGKFLADIADPKFEATSLTMQDVRVNFFQNTALDTGTYHAKGSYQGKSYDHVGRFTDTWVFADAKGQCVASHTSLLQK
jgi:hypothetical protein